MLDVIRTKKQFGLTKDVVILDVLDWEIQSEETSFCEYILFWIKLDLNCSTVVAMACLIDK